MKQTYELVGKKQPIPIKNGKVFTKRTTAFTAGSAWQTGIKCRLCYSVTWDKEAVKSKYCPKCGFFHSEDWTRDTLITMKRKTDAAFAIKLLRALILYRLHGFFVGALLFPIMCFRMVKRVLFPPTVAKRQNIPDFKKTPPPPKLPRRSK
jgi:ribosomal protein L37E